MAAHSVKEAYYYANGKRIDLAVVTNRLAVPKVEPTEKDAGKSRAGGLRAGAREAIQKGRTLTNGLVLVDAEKLDAVDRQELEAMEGAQRVFQCQGALVIALPEIRIEDSRPAKLAAVKKWLKRHEATLDVEEAGNQITVRPRSKQGLDALSLAAKINEELQVELAQPRFVRIVPSPSKR
jgi:hypothetical protein